MLTIENCSFIITNPPQPKYRSLTCTNKHSPSQTQIHQQKHSQTQQQQECQFLNSISKKYLYFHQQQKQPPQQNHKITFPYNPLNLCYFENKFGGKKDLTQRKTHNFNSNRSIRKFLDSKLRTQPIQTKLTKNEKQIYNGKKLSQMKHKKQQLSQLKKQYIHQGVSKQTIKNSGNQQKCEKINKFPLVLKIKSKKAYFLSRFKNKVTMQEQIGRMNTLNMRNNIDDQHYNPFEMKFRSKTQDNINLINLMREQTRKDSTIKKSKAIFNTIKDDKVDPWQINNHFMDSSLKFDDKF